MCDRRDQLERKVLVNQFGAGVSFKRLRVDCPWAAIGCVIRRATFAGRGFLVWTSRQRCGRTCPRLPIKVPGGLRASPGTFF